MKKALVLSLVLLVVAFGAWFAWGRFLDSDYGLILKASQVFDSISVGDSEESLVEALERRGIAFHKAGEGTTVYFHSDGFLGVYFYFVENGRVVKKAVD